MNILFLARLYKPHVGGVEKHIEELSKILHKRHNVTLVVEQHDPNLPLYEEYPEIKVYRIPVFQVGEKLKKFVIWKWWLSHLDLISASDIVHIHDVFFWLLPFRLLFPFKKMFITFHGYENVDGPGLRQIIWHKLGELGTQGNICVGDFLTKWYHTRPTLVTYGAIDLRKLDTTAHTKNKIVFLGRLAKDTGIMDCLTAIKEKKIALDVYGDGPLRVDAEMYSKQHSLAVKYFGFVSNADILLPRYSLVITSGYLGIIEALYARRPVISTYTTQFKHDYLSLAPFAKFIDICGNPYEISQAIDRILSAPTKQVSRVISGYNWARTQTWEKLAADYENLWNQRVKNASR